MATTEDVTTTEDEKVAEYRHLLSTGLSDYEAAETVWPAEWVD